VPVVLQRLTFASVELVEATRAMRSRVGQHDERSSWELLGSSLLARLWKVTTFVSG
jgi:hypothetical protein